VFQQFAASKKLYALDETTFKIASENDYVSRKDGKTYTYFRQTVDAVWFSRRRSSGKTAVFFGTISNGSTNEIHSDKDTGQPLTYVEFLARADGRAGGNPAGCWDGSGTWWDKDYARDFEAQQDILPFLKDMLANYPQIPLGYNGWYRFQD
jgi:hypothetical protein